MNTHRYDEAKRKQWVMDKISKTKTVKQICREALISRATLYNWLDEFERLSGQTESRSFAEQLPEGKASRPELISKTTTEAGEAYRMLTAAIAGIDSGRSFSKKLVAVLVKRFTLTVPQACGIVGMDEADYGYRPRKPEAEDYIVYEALVNLIHEDRTRGFETCYALLLEKNPGWTRKQIKRVYRDGMVYLERTRANNRWQNAKNKTAAPEDTATAEAEILSPAANRIQKPGTTWSLGLLEVNLNLEDGLQPWWMLCIVEEETGLALNAVHGFGAVTTEDILKFLDKAVVENAAPKKMKVPGKPALAIRELTRWVWQHKMALHNFTLNKAENLAAIQAMENGIFKEIGLDSVCSRNELDGLIEGWIAKPGILAEDT